MQFVKVGEGKPVVWLHGWGCDGSIYLPIANLLPDCSNYLVDFAGFGKSEPPPDEGWTVRDYAADLHAFLRQNGLGNVLIVGHSFGCRVAMRLAEAYPRDVSKMLFVAPAGLRKFSLKRWWRVRVYKFKKRLGKMDMSHASEDYLRASKALRNTFVKVVNEDLSKTARRVTCPVLIVNGRDDSETPLWHAEKLAKLLPHGSLTLIDGGHFAFFFNPVAFAETVKIFAE